MNNSQSLLPAGFEILERFAPVWGDIDSAVERFRMRQRSPEAALEDLYKVGAPLLTRIFDYLDTFSISELLPVPERTLYHIAQGIIEAGQFIEMYGGKTFPYTYGDTDKPARLIIDLPY